MGWTVLYVAFGIVALWLLGEVLLQYKARLRWRLLAFGGFLCVVFGVLLPSVVVIALGAIAFAVGQTYVTLSFRRGFSTGWALGGSPGASRRRKSGGRQGEAATREPTLEVSDLAYEAPAAPDLDPEPVYEPQPLPDDTGQYGVYSDAAYAAMQQDQNAQNADNYGQPAGRTDGQYDPYYGYDQQPTGQDAFTGQYDYGTGQQQYAAYSDPYVGGQQYSTYENYDSFGSPQQQQYTDPYYAQPSYSDTPPGGVWVPQQRDTDQQVPGEQQSPYGYDNEYNEQQYRY
ncbi:MULTISPECIES: hypothetical protein [unclassified Streptomyces]|uniref:hypothetical protein n=1 Tax=unclassified Streptomyces TaxID=2593676 RepID=UPI002E298FCC|nr:hypothetical protein [Streptomyces sp. NBC_00306]